MMSTPEKSFGSDGLVVDCPNRELYGMFDACDVTVTELTMTQTRRTELLFKPLDRFDWFGQAWGQMTSKQKARLCENVQLIHAESFFSGIGGFESLLHVIVEGINSVNGGCLKHVPVLSATECAKNRQRILQTFPIDSQPWCIFGEIEERLPVDVYKDVLSMTPSDPDVCDAARRVAYHRINALVEETYSNRPRECRKAPCVLHPDGACRTQCDSDSENSDSGPYDDVVRPWKVVGSSPVCTDATRMGARRGDSGPAMRGLSVWRANLKSLQPAIAFSECVVDWSPKVQASALSDSQYVHFHAKITAKASGDVYNRDRGVTLSIDQEKAHVLIVLMSGFVLSVD